MELENNQELIIFLFVILCRIALDEIISVQIREDKLWLMLRMAIETQTFLIEGGKAFS